MRSGVGDCPDDGYLRQAPKKIYLEEARATKTCHRKGPSVSVPTSGAIRMMMKRLYASSARKRKRRDKGYCRWLETLGVNLGTSPAKTDVCLVFISLCNR